MPALLLQPGALPPFHSLLIKPSCDDPTRGVIHPVSVIDPRLCQLAIKPPIPEARGNISSEPCQHLRESEGKCLRDKK